MRNNPKCQDQVLTQRKDLPIRKQPRHMDSEHRPSEPSCRLQWLLALASTPSHALLATYQIIQAHARNWPTSDNKKQQTRQIVSFHADRYLTV